VSRPRPDGSDLREVTPADVPVLAPRLAAAFQDDPGMSWAFRDAARRPAKLERSFAELMRRVWLPRGIGHTTTDGAGAALWLPPGGWRLPVGLQLRLTPHMLRLAGIETWKVVAMNAKAESRHPEPPHWYLALLGVDPASQGRGYGPHLTRPILERCDAEGTPAYLETGTERNVALYRGMGFEVRDEFDLPASGPHVWCMWREPRA
jgi:ribosomal protein S18 acetylase RimI-like enzyme